MIGGLRRIRQIVLAVPKLAPAVEDFCDVFNVHVAYRDPEVEKFGIENAMFVFGDQFLELVAPLTDNAAVARHLARNGASPYMFIVQTDDLDGDRRRAEALGVRTIWTSERETIRASHFHPKDVGGAILSLDEPEEAAEWPWAGPDWKAAKGRGRATGFVSAEIEATEPAALAGRWGEVIGVPASAAELSLSGAQVTFCPGSADGFVGVGIGVTDPAACLRAATARGLPVEGATITLVGTRLRLVPAA